MNALYMFLKRRGESFTGFSVLKTRLLIPLAGLLILLTSYTASATQFPAIYWFPASSGLLPDADIETVVNQPATLVTIYAGTFGDGIYRSTDNGETWEAINNGLPVSMHIQNALTVDPISTTILYAGDYYGFESGLYCSLDSGNQWSLVLPGASLRAVASSPLTPGLVLAGDRNDGLYRSLDWGETWEPITVTAGLTDTRVSVITFQIVPTPTVYVAAGQSVFSSTDDGLAWQYLGALPSNIFALTPSPITSTLLLAGTFTDGVYRSEDGGHNWLPGNAGLPAGAWVTSLAFDSISPTVAYAGAWDGQVFRSTDSGQTWEGLGYLGHVYALAVHPTAPGVIFAGTSNNGLFRGSTLDHLTIEPIANPQYVRQPFEITLTARDALGFPLTGENPLMLASITDARLAQTLAAGGYMGTATLVDTTGTLTPTQVALVDGVAVLPVTVSDEAYGVTITATLLEGVAITSNPFDVIWAARLFLPLVWK